MSPQPPAALGMPLTEVDTPALIVDLDAFERNLGRMADFAGQAGMRLRPHAKTHKSPEVARRQVALDRKGTRLNSSHSSISYAVFCLKKKTTTTVGPL